MKNLINILFRFNSFFFYLLITSVLISGCQNKEQYKEGVGPCLIYEKLTDPLTHNMEINYGNKVMLLGIDFHKLNNNQIKITSYWYLKDDLGSYNKVFVHFVDADGNTQGYDHEFCNLNSHEYLKEKFIKETYVVNYFEQHIERDNFINIGLYSPLISHPNPRLQILSAHNISENGMINKTAHFFSFKISIPK